VSVDGSAARQLTFEHGYTWGATWSPDGHQVAFNAWRPGGGSQDLFVVDAAGGTPRRLTTDPAQDQLPSWSSDGTRIVFRRLQAPPDGGRLMSIAADGSDERELSRDPGAAVNLTSGGGAWGVDGRIAYVRNENPPADAHPLVREDLATASLLLATIVLAFVAVLLARIRPPFGAYTLLAGVPAALLGILADRPQFIPGAVVGGLAVDVLVRLAPDHRKVVVAGAGSAVALVVAAEITVAATAGLGWSLSLLSGVVAVAASIGWGLAETIGSRSTGETGVGG
jgi:WD40 repeat protein